MRTHHIVALIVTCAAAMAAAQASTAPPSSAPTPTPPTAPAPTQASTRLDKPLVLIGCVAADRSSANRFTLSDTKSGVRYALGGKPVALYSGRRVRIIGGLHPSPNVAAQAGSIDASKAATAAAHPSSIGRADPVEFTITDVRALAGSCPP